MATSSTTGATLPLQARHYVSDELSEHRSDGSGKGTGLSTVADAGVVSDGRELVTVFTCG